MNEKSVDQILGTPVNIVLHELTKGFVSVHYFDIEADTFVSIRDSSKFVQVLPDATGAQELLSRSIGILMKPEVREDAERFYDLSTLTERMGDKESLSFEYQGSLRGWCVGTFIPVIRNADGQIKTALYTVQEVNEERTRERFQQEIIDVLSRGFLNVYLVNPAENLGRIIKLNGYVTKGLENRPTTNFDYWQMVSAYANARILEEDRPRFLTFMMPENLLHAMEHMEEYSFPYRITEADGSIHHYQARLVKTDNPDWYVAAFENIDALVVEEKRRADELQHALQLAERASKSKTDFLSRMSHDIRTPMNGIVGMLTIMRKQIDDRDKVLESMQKVDMLTHQLEALLNDVLEMSRIESGSITFTEEPFCLPEALREIRPTIQTLAEARDVVLAGSHFHIQHKNVIGSPLYIQRIFMNICTNAVKYNRAGGTMECWMWEKPIDDRHSTYVCQVTDTGIGMSAEFVQHIFEPFTRESNELYGSSTGTGLGMAITKELVDKMGGTIEVQSQQGVGSTFVVKLPLAISDEPMPAVPEADEISLNGIRVLLVEDNKINRDVAEFMLTDSGATVEIATDGMEAVEKFRGHEAGTYDLILMDLMMPIMNGLDATKAIRAFDRADAKTIPIVAMTANAFEEDIQNCLRAGMNDHIAKPIELEILKRKVFENWKHKA